MTLISIQHTVDKGYVNELYTQIYFRLKNCFYFLFTNKTFKNKISVFVVHTYVSPSCIYIHALVLTSLKMSRVVRKQTFWFPTWSDTNQAVQLQNIDRGLKFRVKKAEGLYFLCSKNKGADQLPGYSEADLRLCFRICKMLVFSRRGSNVSSTVFFLRSVCFICAF